MSHILSMEPIKGTIALDIDGTLTVNHHHLEPAVATLLDRLSSEGWRIILLTGRTFAFAEPIFSSLSHPYLIGVQNGAALYTMPGEKQIHHCFISKKQLHRLTHIFEQESWGLLLESGHANLDRCYYLPAAFSPEESDYLSYRMSIARQEWISLSTYNDLPTGEIAAAKFFAPKAKAQALTDKIKEFSITMISDPFRPGYFIGLITHPEATKGKTLSSVTTRPLIVAGDDYNDLPMLEMADIKIVMETAPKDLQAIADIVAPPAKEQGIIPALEEALLTS